MTGKISSDGLMQDNIQTPPANGLAEYERHDEGQDKGQGEDDEEEQEGGNYAQIFNMWRILILVSKKFNA